MITYNHEKYISEAIEGVLMQKATFPIELIIGEDCSTDNTREIVLEYAEKYPDIIHPLLPEGNLGMMRNFIKTMEDAKGKYIALCEGDDYWTDPYKLQKQINFLETNRDFIACFHNARVINNQNRISLFNKLDETNYPTIEDIVSKKWFIATASLMFRNNVITLPNWFINVVNGDYALELLLAVKGDFYFMHDIMSVYRHHEASVSSDLNKRKIYLYEKLIELYNNVRGLYGHEYQDVFNERIHSLTVEIEKQRKINKYPMIIYFEWRYYKRKAFKFLKIKRDLQ